MSLPEGGKLAEQVQARLRQQEAAARVAHRQAREARHLAPRCAQQPVRPRPRHVRREPAASADAGQRRQLLVGRAVWQAQLHVGQPRQRGCQCIQRFVPRLAADTKFQARQRAARGPGKGERVGSLAVLLEICGISG